VGGSEHPLSAEHDEELEQGSMAGLSEEQLATFRERAVPQRAFSMRDAVSLADDRRLDVPGTMVCTAFRRRTAPAPSRGCRSSTARSPP
jgi:hypothetical protein